MDASVNRAECGRFVAFKEEFWCLYFTRFNGVGVGFGEVFFAVISTEAQGGGVEFDRRGLPLELLGNGRFKACLVDAQKFGKNTDVDDVCNQLCEFGVDLSSHGGHGDRVGDDVFAFDGFLLGVAVPDNHRTRFQSGKVFVPRCGIDEHLNVRAVAGCLVAFVRQTNDVPRGQTGDVGRKQVLPADGDAHVKQ